MEENNQSDTHKNSVDITTNRKVKIIDKEKEINDECVTYKAPDGSGTIYSFNKKQLVPEKYIKTPFIYPLTPDELNNLLQLLDSNNDKQLFEEILVAYAYGAFIPAIISCKALLESLIDSKMEQASLEFNDSNNKPKVLSVKLKELNIGQELKDFSFFMTFISNKATHEIFKEYGRNFDKIKATILLSCTLLIIKEIKNYEQFSTARTRATNPSQN